MAFISGLHGDPAESASLYSWSLSHVSPSLTVSVCRSVLMLRLHMHCEER